MKRAQLTIDPFRAAQAGELRHQQVIAREFAHRHGVRVIDATFDTVTGRWTFEVETDAKELPAWPPYMTARPHR
jgi:hypothetical protein